MDREHQHDREHRWRRVCGAGMARRHCAHAFMVSDHMHGVPNSLPSSSERIRTRLQTTPSAAALARQPRLASPLGLPSLPRFLPRLRSWVSVV